MLSHPTLQTAVLTTLKEFQYSKEEPRCSVIVSSDVRHTRIATTVDFVVGPGFFFAYLISTHD